MTLLAVAVVVVMTHRCADGHDPVYWTDPLSRSHCWYCDRPSDAIAEPRDPPAWNPHLPPHRRELT